MVNFEYLGVLPIIPSLFLISIPRIWVILIPIKLFFRYTSINFK